MKQTIRIYRISNFVRVEDFGTGMKIVITEKENCRSSTTNISNSILEQMELVGFELVEQTVPSFAEILRQCFNEHMAYYRSFGCDPTIISRTMDRLGFKYGWHSESKQYKRIKAIAKRYGRFVNYIKEIEPQWENIGDPIYYADNSIEQKQQDKYGNIRTNVLKAPNGDACY